MTAATAVSKSISISKRTPASQGYSMPGEWAAHESTWLAWPHNLETWPGGRLPRVERAYVEMIRALIPHERVNLLVKDEKEWGAVLKKVGKAKDIARLIPHFVYAVDTWIRDYGPTYIQNSKGTKAWCKWIFNAWGGKYPSLALDTHIFERQHERVPFPCFDAGFILEGGSIEVNGAGTCMTTEQCLLNPNRNGFSRAKLEKKLKDYLGVKHIVWLKDGIVGDDTDGHIDDLSRFVNARTIVTAVEDNPRDENYSILKDNWHALKASCDQDDRPWNLVKLPMPEKIASAGIRLPASYANFYIANKVILLPVYDCKADKKAISILQDLFPKRDIVPIPSRDLVYGLGSVHCVSQQEPA
jgi:agmatine deiminase